MVVTDKDMDSQASAVFSNALRVSVLDLPRLPSNVLYITYCVVSLCLLSCVNISCYLTLNGKLKCHVITLLGSLVSRRASNKSWT